MTTVADAEVGSPTWFAQGLAAADDAARVGGGYDAMARAAVLQAEALHRITLLLDRIDDKLGMIAQEVRR